MDENLRRVFDQVKPSGEQKEAMLDRLLESERKGRPMRKLKKLTVIGIAAALMIVTCAAAVVTGIDQRLLDFMGWGRQAQELLAPGAMPVDVTVEDNGASLHVSQVLRDRYSVLLLADFTAPEGTVLETDTGDDPFITFSGAPPELLDGDGTPVSNEHAFGWNLVVLEDEDPEDNRLSLLFTVEMMDGIGEEVRAISLSNADLIRFDAGREESVTLYAGNWSCEVPLPQNDTGWSQYSGTVLELPDAVVYERGIYLSPMSLEFTLGMEESLPIAEKHRVQRLYFYPDTIMLTDQAGREISLGPDGSGSGTTDETRWLFQLPEIIDPSRFQGGTLTLVLGGQTFAIPLDDLAPAGSVPSSQN